MTTFSIVEDASVGASGVSAGVIASVKAHILAAAEIWNRYFSQAGFDIKIELAFSDLSGATLATGGSGLSFTGGEGPGLEVWKVDTLEEYITGSEVGGTDVDATITVDTPKLLAGDFFFDPDPFARTAAVTAGKNDFMSVMLHELGHAFGFLSINPDGMDAVDDTDTSDSGFIDLTPFDVWVDPDVPGGRSFVGPAATVLLGGNILLDPGSGSHLAKASDGGFENLMDPSLLVGSRSYIEPIHIAILEDIGMPIRKPTGGADHLFGFDVFDDDVRLLSGDDTFDGLSGRDSVQGNNGDDTISGGAGNDDLRGSNDNDRLNGNDGRDFLRGNSGFDDLRGGSGGDTLDGGTENDELRGASGDDTLNGRFGRDLLSGGVDDDFLRGHEGGDTLNGGDDNDTLFGNPGDDTVLGGDGADDVRGGNDDDLVEGGTGADTLRGNSGDDTLNGGAGADTLIGGLGDDLFRFELGGGADEIKDFSLGGVEDEVELSGFGAAYDSFAEIINAASQVGSDTMIDFGDDDVLTILDTALTSLTAADFGF